MENHEDECNTQYSNSIEECSDDMHSDSDSDSGSVNILDDGEEKGRDTNEARICETPVIGMVFDNDEDAYQYYNSYARSFGFSVRKQRLNRNRQGVNAAKRLSQVFNEFKTFSKDFKKCVYYPETVEEFELEWQALLDDYGLGENTWLEGLYKLREKWAQVYARSHFCAGMTTSQRSESINKFLKKFFKRKLILREFVVQYDKAIADRREKKRLVETATMQTKRNLFCAWNVEYEASKFYTRKIFHYFQDELKKLVDWRLEFENDDGKTRKYKVVKLVTRNLETREIKRSVIYIPSTQSVSCSCRKFEFDGILCAHALKLFRELEFSSLPSKYYLKRWSNDVTYGLDFDIDMEALKSNLDSSSMVQYSELSHIAQRIIVKGTRNDQSYTFVKSELLKLEEKVESRKNSEQRHAGTNDDIKSHNHENDDGENMRLCDPKIQKSVGRGKGRMKNALEAKHSNKKVSSKRKDYEEPTPPVDALQKQSYVDELQKKSHGDEGSSGQANQNHMSTHYSNIFQIIPDGQGILYQNHPSTHYVNGFLAVPGGEGNIPQQNHPYTHYPNGFLNVPIGQRIPYHPLGYQIEHPSDNSRSQIFVYTCSSALNQPQTNANPYNKTREKVKRHICIWQKQGTMIHFIAQHYFKSQKGKHRNNNTEKRKTTADAKAKANEKDRAWEKPGQSSHTPKSKNNKTQQQQQQQNSVVAPLNKIATHTKTPLS
ncbi:hypothetical protein Q3G72_001593 [Acer saccharum]|nr:hypothetical protein Q3G72_001593 [Acer saccharum]